MGIPRTKEIDEVLDKRAQLEYTLVGSWKSSHKRYINEVAFDALEAVDRFYRSEQIDTHASFHTLIANAGRNGDNAGEATAGGAIINVYHDDLVHRKITVAELGSTITHEMCHLLRDREQPSESVGDYIAHEGIAYLVGALFSYGVGYTREYKYISKVAQCPSLPGDFKRTMDIASKKRNPIDALFDDLMMHKRFRGFTSGPKNRAMPIGVAVGVKFAMKRRAEGVSVVDLVRMPTSEFFRGELE